MGQGYKTNQVCALFMEYIALEKHKILVEVSTNLYPVFWNLHRGCHEPVPASHQGASGISDADCSGGSAVRRQGVAGL